MGLIKQTQESYTKGVDVPAISPLNTVSMTVSELEHAAVAYTVPSNKYINKDKRILVQGILQAVVQSQGLLLEPNNGYINKVKEVTLDLVKFVEENSK